MLPTLKGRGTTVPSLVVEKKTFNIREMFVYFQDANLALNEVCYGEIAQFLKTSQSFDHITTLTYVLMDNFCPRVNHFVI